MKLTAQMTKGIDGRAYYALHIDDILIPRQKNIKLEQSVDDLDLITVTLQGRVNEHGVMQICEADYGNME